MTNLEIRTKLLTNAEFRALERHEGGRIADMATIYCLLTRAQVAKLHCDDWSYYEELAEEDRCLAHEDMRERGLTQ